VLDGKWHYQDGRKCPWNASSVDSALALHRNQPNIFNKELIIDFSYNNM
jgi:hypothetical protein